MLENPFDIIFKELNSWYVGSVRAFPSLIVAIITLLFFIVLAKYIRKLTHKVLASTSSADAATSLISNILYITVIIIGIMVALSTLNLEGTVNKLLAGAGIIGLGISFAFQDIIANLFSGAIIALKGIVKIGDIIETNTIFGAVTKIGLRTVEIHNLNGQIVVIPSRLVLQNPITNYTVLGKRRITLEVGVSYSENLQMVKELVIQTIYRQKDVLTDEAIECFFTKFDSSSINFISRFWIKFNDQTQYLEAVSNAIINIKSAFDENNITIPFPIRTLDFKTTDVSKLIETKI